mgnify:FL=1
MDILVSCGVGDGCNFGGVVYLTQAMFSSNALEIIQIKQFCVISKQKM